MGAGGFTSCAMSPAQGRTVLDDLIRANLVLGSQAGRWESRIPPAWRDRINKPAGGCWRAACSGEHHLDQRLDWWGKISDGRDPVSAEITGEALSRNRHRIRPLAVVSPIACARQGDHWREARGSLQRRACLKLIRAGVCAESDLS